MSFFDRKSGGLIDTGARVNFAAAGNANAAAVYTLPSSTNLLGTKSVIIKKIRYTDNGVGGTFLHIGTGAPGAVVDLIPPIKTVNGFDGELDVDIESALTVMAFVDAVGASSVDVQLTVEIKG